MVSESNLKIVFIGAGNLATNLAYALFNSGFHILQVYSRSNEPAEQLAALVKSAYTTKIDDITKDADIYFICVPDKVIKIVADKIDVKNGIVVHTSGSTNISTLASTKSKGYGVFYPFQTFSKNRIVPFSMIPICLEANNDDTFKALHRLASLISSNVIPMDSATRTWLHLTGVFANNFSNHLLAISQKIASDKGFNFDLIKPLVSETIEKAFKDNPDKVQTGPAVRFDQSTIELHIEKLKEYSPELAEIYKELSLSIQIFTKK